MPPLFGKNHEKTAQEAAAETECERLSALPVADLAAEILPAFGTKRPANGPIMAADWLMASYRRGVRAKSVKELQAPVRAPIEALEHAGLLDRDRSNVGSQARLILTSLGETALAQGSARRYL